MRPAGRHLLSSQIAYLLDRAKHRDRPLPFEERVSMAAKKKTAKKPAKKAANKAAKKPAKKAAKRKPNAAFMKPVTPNG